jgi:DNA repair exonuclease SbcCD ATPase subunit
MGHKLPGSRQNYFDVHDVDEIAKKYSKIDWSRESLSAIENFSDEVNRLKEKVSSLEEENQSLKTRLNGWGNQTNELQTLRDDVNALMAELKALKSKKSARDTFSGEIKNKQRRLNFVNIAKPFVLGNRFPKVNDEILAFWDRVILVSFPNSFIDKEQIPNIEKQWLDDADEVSGILNWMIEGLHRLLINGFFTQSQIEKETITEFKRVSDTIGAWLEERVVFERALSDTRHY